MAQHVCIPGMPYTPIESSVVVVHSREQFDYGLLVGRRSGATVSLFITRTGDTLRGAVGISPTGERFAYRGVSRFGTRHTVQPFYRCCGCGAPQAFAANPKVQTCARCEGRHGWYLPKEFLWEKIP